MSAPGAPNLFGLGAQIFGDVSESSENEKSPDPTHPSQEEAEDDDGDDDDDGDSDDGEAEDAELVTAMAATSLESSAWKATSAYSSLYLDTVTEYLPPAPKPRLAPGVQVDMKDDDKGDKDLSWAMEGYENSLDVDHAFERFTKRIASEPEQCIRFVLVL